MTRTAHHVRPPHSRSAYDRSPGEPWRSVVLHDLRYSARGFTDATREFRRPRPRAVRRAVDVYSFARYQRDDSVAQWSAMEERRARQRLRTQVGTLPGLVNTSVGVLVLDAVDAVEIPPARHRHGSLWHA
ncbi:hypothetical protein OR263_14295 [Streptomyces sp. NEAU-H22]|uniref:hypothetical protein n=1 Tax=Streptomyces sp. NEAU-H22 TaxID=2994655 RepID=UPI00224D19AD|nr:hypothetical protein [Streptomyces sp. NEAU-H22]MCX3287861.1 hypothetical protein [Streptomyces sp. NEAU-H22]